MNAQTINFDERVNDVAVAVRAAMENCIAEPTGFGPHDPAILFNLETGKIEYGSKLYDGYAVLWDLYEGFGAWSFDSADDIPDIYEAAARDLVECLNRKPRVWVCGVCDAYHRNDVDAETCCGDEE